MDMDDPPDGLPPSFTRLTFESEDGRFGSMSVHDPVSEVKDLYYAVEEAVNELREGRHSERLDVDTAETILPRDLRQQIVALYALSSGLIESFAVELLLREFVEEQHRANPKARRIFERRTGVRTNIRLLRFAGIIDNDLHGELLSVVDKRHDYVHQPSESLYIEDYDQFLSEARRCKRATKELAIVLDGDDYRRW